MFPFIVSQRMEILPSPVPWSRIAVFVRQLGHDIRNDLNALSLEAALLKELVDDPEATISANRIQSQLREIGNRLKELSSRFTLSDPQVCDVDLQEVAAHLQKVPFEMEWEIGAESRMVRTDPALLARAFEELARNAAEKSRGTLRAALKADPTGATLILTEQGGEGYAWTEVPFAKPTAGHYGVGLPIAGAILRGLGATVEQMRVDGGVETRIHLPAA